MVNEYLELHGRNESGVKKSNKWNDLKKQGNDPRYGSVLKHYWTTDY